MRRGRSVYLVAIIIAFITAGLELRLGAVPELFSYRFHAHLPACVYTSRALVAFSVCTYEYAKRTDCRGKRKPFSAAGPLFS